jgi:predicted phosphodiesterase
VRIAALYDVHGNLPALEAVLAEVEAEYVDRIVVGGDVLWGPFQSECLTALRDAGGVFVSGNCERDVLAGVDDSSVWCRAQLAAEELELVAGWPPTIELDVDGLGTVVCCHATPRSDVENLTRATPDGVLAEALREVTADVVVGGHTHVQLDREVPGGPRLVNAGSVGLPFQGAPGAFWALLGPGVELRRTPYDVDAAVAALRSSGFPGAAEFEDSIRGRASAESATAYFESRPRDGR